MPGISGNAGGGASIVSAHVTTQFDKTNNTLADVPGLSVTLGVGTYAVRIEASLSLHFLGSGQIKMTGTLAQAPSTNNAWLFESDSGSGSVIAQPAAYGSQVSLTTNAVSGNMDHTAIITGTIIVSTGGTLKLQFAQDATNASASSVLVGSYIMATRIN